MASDTSTTIFEESIADMSLEGNYDGVILYSELDRNSSEGKMGATEAITMLKENLSSRVPDLKLVLLEELPVAGQTDFTCFDNILNNVNYIFIFLTPNCKKDTLTHFQSQMCLKDAIVKANWRVIPLKTEQEVPNTPRELDILQSLPIWRLKSSDYATKNMFLKSFENIIWQGRHQEFKAKNPSAKDSNPTGPSVQQTYDEPSPGQSSRKDTPLPAGNGPMDKTETSLTVAVKHSTKTFYADHHKKAYPMKQSPRGKALILNVHTVVGATPRLGTNTDKDNLCELLRQLDFEVKVYNDTDGLQAEEMRSKLEKFSRLEDHVKAECVVVCILSHGNEGCVSGTDGKKLKLEDIFELFDNRRCIDLIGKPKIFIFQACRGNKVDEGTTADTAQSDTLQPVPTTSDTLKCFPTQDGYKAWRDPTHGSWFIGALVQVFMEYACNEDVCTMLHRVNDHVSEKGDKIKAMSEYISTLKKPHLYFFPGIKDTIDTVQ